MHTARNLKLDSESFKPVILMITYGAKLPLHSHSDVVQQVVAYITNIIHMYIYIYTYTSYIYI